MYNSHSGINNHAICISMLNIDSVLIKYSSGWSKEIDCEQISGNCIIFASTGIINSPRSDGNIWGLIIQIARYNDDTKRQIVLDNNGDIFCRVFQSEQWHTWKKITTQSIV